MAHALGGSGDNNPIRFAYIRQLHCQPLCKNMAHALGGSGDNNPIRFAYIRQLHCQPLCKNMAHALGGCDDKMHSLSGGGAQAEDSIILNYKFVQQCKL